MMWLATFGFFMLAYIYGGYIVVLKILACLARFSSAVVERDVPLPTVTVLITVFNEVTGITARVQNVLDCDYPANRLEVLIASDGSTDGTDERVSAIEDERVRLFRPIERCGKTDTQNQAIALARGEIVIFTDADTRFDAHFIKEIVGPFVNPEVGGVDGHLLFSEDASSGVSQSQGFYWRQELQIRTLESRLGILAVASGACMAVRRLIIRPMLASVGEDCLIPLDVVDQGYKMVHSEKALAFDNMEHESRKEFRTRVRMTLRNWQGTLSYPQLLNPVRRPGIAWALWSHKMFRWLSPFFLLAWLSGSLVLLGRDQIAAALPAVFFLIAAIAGALKVRVPGVSFVFSFCLANAGFFVGVLKAALGKKMMTYR